MNLQLIGQLIRLRYRLLWAKTRTRNGRIALFIAGYLLLALVIAFLAAGGFGTAFVAARSGKAEGMAQGLLTGFFISALFTSVMLGFGINVAFTDTELRRYPLRAAERLFARHFTGAVDPFWCLFLALELGLAVGLSLFGAGSLLLGVPGVLLLFVCNYLAARVAGMLLDLVMQRKSGAVLLPLAIMALCIVPGMAAPILQAIPGLLYAVGRALRFTPAFGAGSLMTRTDAAALQGFATLVVWLAGLAIALAVLEKRPVKAREAQSSRVEWDTPLWRIGALFGPRYGPLVTCWLQFYSRCRRFRVQYLLALPLVPFLLLMWTRRLPMKSGAFATALGVFAIVGLAPAAAFVVNQFGYVGGGFRRFCLFPADPAAALRASSYALMAACSPFLVLAALCWVLFGPAGYDARALAMLVAAGVFGMFFFHGVGLWATLYGARRSDPNQFIGNDLSLVGNIVVVGGMTAMIVGPMVAGQVRKDAIRPDQWWIVALLAALAAAFYRVSLARAAAILPARRERLLAAVEGKS